MKTNKPTRNNLTGEKIERYWFRKRQGIMSKDMGYGWVPISWEGWLSVGVLIVGILVMMFYFQTFNEETVSNQVQFLISVLLWIVIFAFFAKSKSKN